MSVAPSTMNTCAGHQAIDRPSWPSCGTSVPAPRPPSRRPCSHSPDQRAATYAESAQDALLEGLRTWPADPPRDPKAWLVTVAWRRFLDATRSDVARRRREDLVDATDRRGLPRA